MRSRIDGRPERAMVLSVRAMSDVAQAERREETEALSLKPFGLPRR